VEFASELHQQAVENLSRYTGPIATRPVFYCTDASQFQFPSINLVIFMHNPFGGPVMDAVLNHLHSIVIEGREVFIIYWIPMQRDRFDRLPWLHLIRDGDIYPTDRRAGYCIYKGMPTFNPAA
jgi:hypothetical protein